MADIIGRAVIQVVSEIRPGEFAGAGRTAGKQLTGALATSAKVAGAGIAVVLGGAIAKGFSRLSAIEEAEAKLKGLGNSAETVTEVMKNSLDAVKGTAFGLGDAASIAASAVASGVKPGKELERTLRLIADASTIAGTDLAEMGAVFNKVAATGKAQTDVLNQLGDRGIPIVQLLAKELGITNEKVYEFAKDGKINFETFQAALEEGMGGAALKSGETFKGALANAEAALGRFGAALLGPAFKDAPSLLQAITDKLDDMLPVAERVGIAIHNIFGTGSEPPVGTGTVLAPSTGQGAGTVLQPGAQTNTQWSQLGSESGSVFGAAMQEAVDEAAVKSGQSFWEKFIDGVVNGAEPESLTDRMVEKFIHDDFGNAIIFALDQAWDGFDKWFIGVTEDFRNSFWRWWEDVEAQFSEGWGTLTELWDEFWADLEAAWKEDTDNLVKNVKSLPRRIKQTAGDWFDAGKDLITNFFKGLASDAGGVVNDLGAAIKRAVNNGLNLPKTITVGDGKGGLFPDFSFTVPALATGTRNFTGGLALVGERGPELVNLPAGSDVYSNRESSAMAAGSVNITNVYNGPESSAKGRREADWQAKHGTRFGAATTAGVPA